MKHLIISGAVALAGVAALASGNVQAAPIAAGSQISFADGANYNSTSITFLNNGAENIPPNTASGSFAPAFSSGCTGCAQFNNLTFAPLAAPALVYTATLGGITTTFTLTSVTPTLTQSGFLDLLGTGTMTLTGYDPTPGSFLLSAQGTQNSNVSFSATSLATSVPEPATLAVFGAGLFGLGALRRKRSRPDLLA